jgi:hypothetical protein
MRALDVSGSNGVSLNQRATPASQVDLDVRMKSGGRWNFRGLRSDAAAAARDNARRSGMSVGEWLNSVAGPAEAEDDERRWSADAEEADRSVRRSKQRFRDREARPQPERSGRRRDEALDEPRGGDRRYGDDPRYDDGRRFARDDQPTPRAAP